MPALDEISKRRAIALFRSNALQSFEIGTTRGLQQIHKYLFVDLYPFAGNIRTVNISKDGFRFANTFYLAETLRHIENMPQSTFAEIVERYTEMNIAHPFMEGNGRSARIWLDLILKKNLEHCVNWAAINKFDYLEAMKRSHVHATELRELLCSGLTDKIDDRDVFKTGIEQSYYYEDRS
jgi:cell filamentation protein